MWLASGRFWTPGGPQQPPQTPLFGVLGLSSTLINAEAMTFIVKCVLLAKLHQMQVYICNLQHVRPS